MSDHRRGPSATEEVPLGEKLLLLARPETYPEPERPARVEAIETHMSWVFLTPRFVYKLKKPVRYAFLDFSTSAARRHDCELELTLNRRLARDVYLAVLPLTREPDGELRLAGGGTPVDWLVKMRRLPAERMLDAAIRDRSLRPGDLDGLSRVLANFFRHVPTVGVDPEAHRRAFAQAVQHNCDELRDPAYGLDPQPIERLRAAQLEALERCGAELDRRVAAGWIKEGHGDLRPEHVCLLPVPVVIDCLEFKREFRILDPADELAYLAMECERLGAPEAGEELLQRTLAAAGGAPSSALIGFYKTVRAALRARLAVWHTRDHSVGDHPKWMARARVYLGLAHKYAG